MKQGYAVFTHAGLTTRYRRKSLHQFLCGQGHAICTRRHEIASIKFEFQNLEVCFQKR